MKRVILSLIIIMVMASVCFAQSGLVGSDQIGDTALTVSATAGENITQYDVIKSFYDGSALKSFKYTTSMSASTDWSAAGSTSSQSLCNTLSVSSSKKIIIWIESSTLYYQVLDINVTNGTVTAGSRNSSGKAADMEMVPKICLMDSDKIAIAYDYNSVVYVVVGTISGTSISFGSSWDSGLTSYATNKFGLAIAKLSTTKIAVGTAAGGGDYCYFKAAIFSGTAYSSSGSTEQTQNASVTSCDSYYVSDDKIVISTVASGTGTIVGVMTASGTALTYQAAGQATCISTGTQPGCRVVMITSTYGALLSRNGNNYPIISGFSVSGNNISDGTGDIETSIGNATAVMSICALDGVTYNGCALGFWYNVGTNPIYARLKIFKFSGATPTEGTNYLESATRGNALTYTSVSVCPVGSDGVLIIADDNNAAGTDYTIRKANLVATPVIETYGYSKNYIYGIAQATSSIGNAINFWLASPYRTISGLTLTAGSQYFVNDSTSALSTTVNINKYVGFALTSNKLMFDSMPYNSQPSGTNPVSLQRY